MPPHDFGEGISVGRVSSCGFGDGGDFAEVVRAEDAGTDNCERSGGDSVKVVETVNRSARDAQRVA
jgi:hypothetical protein